MGAELPLLSAVMARMLNPEINLAAYGGVVFPLALLIESPMHSGGLIQTICKVNK